MDAFIAATTIWEDPAVVTRNVADFKALGLPVINPWDA